MKFNIKYIYLALLLVAKLVFATPKLLTTDQALFNELNSLVNRNVIKLNLSIWPLSLSEIYYALAMAEPKSQSEKLIVQYLRLSLKERRDGFSLEAELNSKYPILQTGITNAYDQSRFSAIQVFGSQNLDFHIQVNSLSGKTVYRSKQIDFIGSYVAAKVWNQWISIGQQKRFWGIGHTGSLILGDSARPIIGINMQRDLQTPFKTKWLAWLGRWQYQFFGGQMLNYEGMESPRNTKLIGMRLSISPTDFFDLGFSRVIQWGGRGRPQNMSSLTNALLGRDNVGDNISEEEPGNQIAGVDFRIKLMPLIQWPISVYGQVMGEDESNYLPTQNFYLVGVDGSHSISHRQTWNWYLEGIDTSIDFGRRTNTYQHHIYRDGYYNQKLPLGYPLGSSMRSITFGFNSHYHSSDISAVIKDYHWGFKLLQAETILPKKSNLNKKTYRHIELNWLGEIPINQYIKLKLGLSSWYSKVKEDHNQVGVRFKANISF
ncbi:capsule assembly Wzi family protein [Muribacter muris]|uniref:capsule assembly Wzi family protein n=1 Tax=Muribacter muris TaxID=67855 RepID=UPI00069E92F4|nr:capsule assembly Wzi family protein [Muribacter muris]